MTRQSRLQPLARALLRTQSDDRLVSLAREGRDAAFDEIVRRYRPGLVAFAAGYASRDRAEDVVQESLAASWRAMRESETEIILKPWLYAIVRNRALNARRDARLHEPLPEDLDGVRRPEDVAIANEELARIVAAVNALPAAQRQALVRSAVEGHTHDQIAAALGATPAAIGQLVFRGRAAVRNAVGAAIPLPIVKLLLDAGGTAASGAAGGSAAAAGGASLLTKGAAVAAIGVIAAGSGIAIQRGGKSDEGPDRAAAAIERRDDAGRSHREADSHAPAQSAFAAGDDRGSEVEPSDDHGDDDGGGGGSGGDEGPSESSGPGPSGGSGESGDSGPSDASGHGSSGDDHEDSSETGSGDSGGTTTTTATTEPTTTSTTTSTLDDTESGSGSGSGELETEGSGSSGPG